jgi:hypothetical protein
MTCGEAVLVVGTCFNIGWWLARRARCAATPELPTYWPRVLNVGCVALSNVVMAAVLAARVRPLGVPPQRTVLLWTALLDGTGALLAWTFRGLLKNGA